MFGVISILVTYQFFVCGDTFISLQLNWHWTCQLGTEFGNIWHNAIWLCSNKIDELIAHQQKIKPVDVYALEEFIVSSKTTFTKFQCRRISEKVKGNDITIVWSQGLLLQSVVIQAVYWQRQKYVSF